MTLATHSSAQQGLCAVVCLALLSPPAAAGEFKAVETRRAFLSLVEGARISSLGVTLRILGDGSITGDAYGTTVHGTWQWKDTLFCRRMGWGDRSLPYDCQTVETVSHTLRFTGGKGDGKIRDYWLRRR